MVDSSNRVVVFLAWQSEVFKNANHRAIEASLRAAATRVEDAYAASNLGVYIDKDTTGRSGSPAIADEILKKIDAAHIFVGDVTITNAAYAPAERTAPNANVLVELGFAVGVLGWDRVICLLNKECGHLAPSLPFDVRHRRISVYKLSDDESAKAKNKADGALTELLVAAITETIEKNPVRPAELKGLSDEKIRERRDIENLTWLLQYVHWPTLDAYIEEGPKIRSFAVVDLLDSFETVLHSSYFHLYDSALNTRVKKLRLAWSQALCAAEQYEPARHERWYLFTTPATRDLTKKENADWKAISTGLAKLRPAMNGLLKDIRSRYGSLDITALSETAWRRYIERQKSIE